jgi:hypothetical protein
MIWYGLSRRPYGGSVTSAYTGRSVIMARLIGGARSVVRSVGGIPALAVR